MNLIKRIFDITKNNPLFSGIAFSDFELLLNCLAAKTAVYKKDEVILLSGDTANFVGLILAGSVRIIKESANGDITIVTELGITEAFGEELACAGIAQSPVTILAADRAEILFINYRKAVTSCTNACSFHSRLIGNMLKMIAQKNLILNQKIEILSKRTTRDKLLCFFDMQRGSAKKFSISFNREELAQYLCVDRSAMSNELCKMRDDGLIKFYKSNFEILSS